MSWSRHLPSLSIVSRWMSSFSGSPATAAYVSSEEAAGEFGLREQLPNRFPEHGRMAIHVRLGRGGAHQRHHVERCQEHTTVERVEVHEGIQLRIHRGDSLGAVARPLADEEV